jgi:hypothetical protein
MNYRKILKAQRTPDYYIEVVKIPRKNPLYTKLIQITVLYDRGRNINTVEIELLYPHKATADSLDHYICEWLREAGASRFLRRIENKTVEPFYFLKKPKRHEKRYAVYVNEAAGKGKIIKNPSENFRGSKEHPYSFVLMCFNKNEAIKFFNDFFPECDLIEN